MIRTILIDDEKDSLSVLSILLTEHCPQVEIISLCAAPETGYNAIIELEPDLVFLDIEMPRINGFKLLDKVKEKRLAVIFTTAFQHYAIQAIRYSALDYLVKPIDPKELILGVQRYEDLFKSAFYKTSNLEQYQFLLDKLSKKEHTYKKLAIPNMEGFRLVHIDEILYCEADDNYTHLYLKNKVKITSSRILKEIQALLFEYEMFIRIHHSFLININEVSQYFKGEGGYVILSDGSQLSVSRNKKEALMRYLNK